MAQAGGAVKRVGHLFEQVVSFRALCVAARRAARGKRLSMSAAAFLLDLEPEVLRLERELLDGSYRPASYRTFTIDDPKPRTISAAAFRDRVVHHALCAALEPVLERGAIEQSFACRKAKGTLAAVGCAQGFARRARRFLKLDIRKFFETADHGVLQRQLRRVVKDRRCLELADRFIDAGAPGSPPGKGLPIGNLTSQHFANFYLCPLDHFIKHELRARHYCRYMDDLLIFGDQGEVLRGLRDEIERFVGTRLLLELKEEATILAPVHAGVPYLGFRIWPDLIRLDPRRVRRFRGRFRDLSARLRAGALDDAAYSRSASSLIGWAEQADTLGLRTSFFRNMARGGRLPG